MASMYDSAVSLSLMMISKSALLYTMNTLQTLATPSWVPLPRSSGCRPGLGSSARGTYILVRAYALPSLVICTTVCQLHDSALESPALNSR